MRRTEDLERAIGYQFTNHSLLVRALTHKSYENEHRRSSAGNNERLEFLGDAVLELVSSEYLFQEHPDMKEGELSKLRASMVCEPSLAKCARILNLTDHLMLGRGEEQLGGRKKDSLTSDALEALIGAVYLDGGFEEARKLIRTHILMKLSEEDLFVDTKTDLQEILQERGLSVKYCVTHEEGPDHMKSFTVDAVVDGRTIGTGTGKTKKAAAQAAAEDALLKFRKS